MQIVFNFDELSQIVLAHVRTRMNVAADTVEIPSSYTSMRDNYCVVKTTPKVQQVAPQEQIEAPDF